MRVIILTQYYPPEMGAPQGRLSALAAALARRRHEVTVLTAMPNYPAGRVDPRYGGVFRRERVDGVEVMRAWIHPTRRTAFVPRVASYLSFALSSAVAGTAKLPRAEFLLVESPPLLLGPTAVALARVKGARLVFNVSDLWPASAVRLGALRPGGPAHRLAMRLEAFCYRSAWMVAGQSREIVADVARRFPGTRTVHLSNGVDTAAFHPDRGSGEARALLGGDGGCVAVYAGLHGLAQGLRQLLDAADALRDLPFLRIVLIGDGPEKEALAAEARSRGLGSVTLLDAVPRDRVPGLLAAADVVLVPLATTLPGAVPSKLYEAMASGRPVLVAATGETAEIVRDADAGVVVSPGDPPRLAEALRTLAGDPGLRARLGANGRRAAEARFGRPAICGAFIDLLEREAEG
ncbi:MAG TPA: glycosyltransferase family 4 protein [Longimicrobium sp.]|jgi:glycosyltransferase involved in cell wall biosynthesis|nr:glycosyltransferase family 4 protein [Longimicrobium sp.]